MSTTIHPTAIIGPEVELADNVTIGPYCVLEGKVSVGSGTLLMHHATLKGPLKLGEHNRIYPFVSIGQDPQHLAFDPDIPGAGTIVGDGNIFRESSSVHRATGKIPTTMGNQNMLMSVSHIAHDCIVGNNAILANSALVGGHCTIGDHAFLGANSAAHQNTRIGRMAMLGAQMGVNQDLPPFCLCMENRTISGLNRVGLRRHGLRHAVKSLERAYEILCMGAENNPNAIKRVRAELADSPEAQEMASFIEQSTRGICRHFSRHKVMMHGDSIHLLDHRDR